MAIIIDHGRHLDNQIMSELSAIWKFCHEFSSPYYPQANGQVEVVNKTLKTMLQWMVGTHKGNYNLQLYSHYGPIEPE